MNGIDVGVSRENQARCLRVAVLTRTGCVSGIEMSRAIRSSDHFLCGILAEKRSTMILSMIRRKSIGSFVATHGALFLLARLLRFARSTLVHALRSVMLFGIPRQVDEVNHADLPLHTVHALNSAEAKSILADWRADVLIVANAPVLKPDIFNSCRIMALNFHSGRLPEYGGLASEFWAMYNREKLAWVSIHRVVQKLDSGEILGESAVNICSSDTPETLHEKCVNAGTKLLLQVLGRFAMGDTDPIRVPGPATIHPWPTPVDRRSLRKSRRE